MDEYSSGMDPEVKLFFRKIINSFGVGLLWLLVMGTAGLYFKLALIKYTWHWYNFVFYVLFSLTLVLLIFFFYKLWRKSV